MTPLKFFSTSMLAALLPIGLMSFNPGSPSAFAAEEPGSEVSPSPSPSPSPRPEVTVRIVPGASGLTTDAYDPNPVSVAPGTTVKWVNEDNVTHTATEDLGLFDSGNIAPGQSFSRNFDDLGEFNYHCAPHPQMVGKVVVEPSPSPSNSPGSSGGGGGGYGGGWGY